MFCKQAAAESCVQSHFIGHARHKLAKCGRASRQTRTEKNSCVCSVSAWFGLIRGPGATHLGRSVPRSFVTPSIAQTSAVFTHKHICAGADRNLFLDSYWTREPSVTTVDQWERSWRVNEGGACLILTRTVTFLRCDGGRIRSSLLVLHLSVNPWS